MTKIRYKSVFHPEFQEEKESEEYDRYNNIRRGNTAEILIMDTILLFRHYSGLNFWCIYIKISTKWFEA